MALSLSKTGIAQSNIINAWHVTQSIDAFTGTEAYAITVSGSFTLGGGTTGSGYFASAVKSDTSVISNTVASQYYTLPYLASTGSQTSTLYYSATGPTYNPVTETFLATNFQGTASIATTASFASTYTDPTFVDGTILPSGSVLIPAAALKMIAGGSQSDGTSAATVTLPEIAGKILNQDCFVTATNESPAGDSISVVNLIGPTLTFQTQNPNTNFSFIVMYV